MNFRNAIVVTFLFTILSWQCSRASAQSEIGGASYSVLHFTETSGFDHGTRTQSLAMFQNLGSANGFTVVDDLDGSEFDSLPNLQNFAVVIFSNTSGNNILNATQRANFEAYIESGGSYLGIHAASDTYRHGSANGGSTGTWDWYAENVAGCSVQQNPNHTSQNHNSDNVHAEPGHPVLKGIPNPWNKTEEYYYWQNGYVDPSFTEVLMVGRTGSQSYDAPRMTTHVKELTWGGRAFYTSYGHSSSNFLSDQDFIKLMENAVNWAAEPNVAATTEVTPESVSVERGTFISGSETELAESDDLDLVIQRSTTDVQSRTEFVVETTSPFATPSSIQVVFEGTVFARTTVVLTIDLFNFADNTWEQVDTRDASRFTDQSITIDVSGDLSRFVEAGSQAMRAKVLNQSPIARQRFTSYADQINWVVNP